MIWEIEGLVASAGTLANIAKKQNILDLLDIYDKVDENLRRHDSRYPTADKLRSVTWEGRSGAWGTSDFRVPDKPINELIGPDKDTEASNAIIRVVDRPDPRPVWVAVWGGSCEVAQAIWKVRATRSPAEVERFLSKLRIYLIARQDGTAQWLLDNFPNLFIILAQKTYLGMFLGCAGGGSETGRPGLDQREHPSGARTVRRGVSRKWVQSEKPRTAGGRHAYFLAPGQRCARAERS